MNFKELKKYLGLFILAVAVIAVYKTFDNFNGIIAFFKRLCGSAYAVFHRVRHRVSSVPALPQA